MIIIIIIISIYKTCLKDGEKINAPAFTCHPGVVGGGGGGGYSDICYIYVHWPILWGFKILNFDIFRI